MLDNLILYKKYILFPTLKEKDVVNRIVFWLAVFVLFLLANLSPNIAQQVFSRALELISPNLVEKTDKVVELFFLPIKGFLFLIAFLVILYPILNSCWQSRTLWQQLNTKRIAIDAVLIFLILSVLVFPYGYPHGLNAGFLGLSGLGNAYGDMSLDPFAENNIWVYRRILQPAIAHFIQMDGPLLYYIYSLFCTYLLIFLTTIFVELKIFKNQNSEIGTSKKIDFSKRFWLYVSVATSSYIITGFLWPGYPDQLSFILILLMAYIPMSRQARLGIFALCMVSHDGSAFALTPIALFCSPKHERYKSLLVIAIYFAILLSFYGAGFNSKLETEHLGVSGKSNFQFLLENPGLALAGVSLSYKLLWLLFFYLGCQLWQQKEKVSLVAIAALTFFPVLMIFIALDTTRLIGFGFLGLLISCSILFGELWQKIPKYHHYLLLFIIYSNILIPSHTVVLIYQDSLSTYPYRGIYQLIYSGLQLFIK